MNNKCAQDSLGSFIFAIHAGKHQEYTCPMCESPVVPKQGTVKRHHFAHKVSNECCYYNDTFSVEYCNEGFLHKYTKNFIKSLLEYKLQENITTLAIYRPCHMCTFIPNLEDDCEYVCDYIEYDVKDCHVVLEHQIPGTLKRLDIAILDRDDKIIVGIEVKVTHQTENSSRPFDNWIEVDAKKLSKVDYTASETDYISLDCCRPVFKCDSCSLSFNPEACRKLDKVKTRQSNKPPFPNEKCYYCEKGYNIHSFNDLHDRKMFDMQFFYDHRIEKFRYICNENIETHLYNM